MRESCTVSPGGPVPLAVPEVVTLTGYDRLPAAAVTFSRRNIFKRDHYTCQYCGAQPGMDELMLDTTKTSCVSRQPRSSRTTAWKKRSSTG